MTGREKIVGLIAGTPTAPRIGFDGECDAVIVQPGELGAVPSDKVRLALIVSPLGRAVAEGLDVLSMLTQDPSKGGAELERLESEVNEDIHRALQNGADGVFYCLFGANPDSTTPMQYGGHFLEIDRRLLSNDALFNVIFVQGPSEPYTDFVSDLPAQAFAWDSRSGLGAEAVGEMREGPLMGRDFILAATAEEIAQLAQGKVACRK